MKTLWKSVLALGIIAAIYASMANDPHRDEAEAFLRANEQVRRSVGQVRSASLRRVLVYEGDETKAPFREYSFQVNGTKGRNRVTVRGTQPGSAKDYRFAIEDIE